MFASYSQDILWRYQYVIIFSSSSSYRLAANPLCATLKMRQYIGGRTYIVGDAQEFNFGTLLLKNLSL
jgi:hypothetical protein